jgi:hypothetical protein
VESICEAAAGFVTASRESAWRGIGESRRFCVCFLTPREGSDPISSPDLHDQTYSLWHALQATDDEPPPLDGKEYPDESWIKLNFLISASWEGLRS